jgi:hypothetical protein
MCSRGDAYDDAVAEAFFATLKKELVNRRTRPDRLELAAQLSRPPRGCRKGLGAVTSTDVRATLP